MEKNLRDIVIYSKELKEYLAQAGNVRPIAVIPNPNKSYLDAWVYRPTSRVTNLIKEFTNIKRTGDKHESGNGKTRE
jgi:hypothetical protein